MTRRHRLPDLDDLTGDPSLTREEDSDAPDPTQVTEALDELRRRIDSMPAGSLSGGVPVQDPWASPDTQGYFDATPREGLQDHEKQLLWDQLAPEVMKHGRADWERMEE